MEVDFEAAAKLWDKVAAFLAAEFAAVESDRTLVETRSTHSARRVMNRSVHALLGPVARAAPRRGVDRLAVARRRHEDLGLRVGRARQDRQGIHQRGRPAGRSPRTATTTSSHQKAKNDDATFNVALVEGTSYKDVDLSVRLKAVAGELDRGGGLVWRAKDKKNYYIARYNPLEDNFRVYKVEDGKRTQFDHAGRPRRREVAHAARDDGRAARSLCYLDGKKYLEAEDSTFPEAGNDRPLVQGRCTVVFR